MTGLRAHERHSLALFVLVFILMVSGIAVVGYVSYQVYDQQYRSQVESQLLAIASLKVDELQDWRNERLGDANLFYRNDDFSELVRRYFEDPADADAKNTLASWLEPIQAHPEYDRVFLLDAQGRERLSVPAAPVPTSAYAAEKAAAILASGQITMLDFHRDTPTDVIHLTILVPIFDAPDGNRPLGVLALHIDPYVYLYPFIQRWPVPSDSAETLLVRLDGDHVLYLNELRFQSNTALTLRFSLEQTEILAVKAALGQEGVAQGLDYRGVETIGAVSAVPDSPWFLVARVNAAEALHPLRERLWQTVVFFGALIAAAGVGLVLIWRQQRLRYLQAQVKAQEALTTSEAELSALFAAMVDLVIVYDADGRYVKIPSTNSARLSRPTADILGKTVHEILPKEQADYILATIRAALQSGAVVWAEYSLPIGGKEIWFTSSASRLSENTVMWVAHDITERKQAEILQDAIYKIAQAADRAETLDSLYLSIHSVVQEVMVADNFYITLYDEKNDWLHSPYFVDEVDLPGAAHKPGKGLTEYVLRTAKPLLCDDALFEELIQRGEIELIGTPAPIWLGVPLMIADKVIGVIVVQNYKNAHAYGKREQRILEFVSSQAAMSIHRKQAESQLNEQIVELQRWHNALLGREDRILDLKREVNALLKQAGQPLRYPSAESLDNKWRNE